MASGSARTQAPTRTDPLWDFWFLCWVKAIVELRCLWVRMASQVLRDLDPGLRIFKVRCDAGRPEAAVADIRRNSCSPGTSPEHFPCTLPDEAPAR